MYKTIKSMTQALAEARAYRDPVIEDNKLESAASDKAKGMGLDYLSFGRYGKGGQVSHKNINGTLTAVDKDDKPVKEPEEKMPANVKKVFDDIKDFEITDNNAEQVEKLEKARDDFDDAGKEKYAAEIDSALEELMDDEPEKADDILSDLKQKIKKTEVVKEETITEIRKASVQFSLGMNSDMMKAKKDLEKLGHKVTTVNNKMTVTAKSGSDINRELNDIRNFYDRGVEITAENFEESVELEEETYQLTERDLLKLTNKTGFSKADFKANENDNDHSLNAIMLARAFGSSQEFKDMINIDKRHKERGSINEPDYQKRNALVKKYYSRLK